MQKEILEQLRGFVFHGVKFEGVTGNQAYGECPFTDKKGKFYVNYENLLWDSKNSGLRGNFQTFIELVNKRNHTLIGTQELKELSENRNIPVEELRKWGIGYYEGVYTVPIFNERGKLADLRKYNLGKKLLSTPGCQTGLLNLNSLAKERKMLPVYICEGEWDAMAFNWLITKHSKEKCVVVGVPGANTFKKEWSYFFQGRECVILYDNDGAGEEGEHYVIDRLKGIAKKMKFIHWLDSFTDGFDIRDFIGIEAINNKRPKRCLWKLNQMLKEFPRRDYDDKRLETVNLDKTIPPVDPNMNWEKLTEVVRTWLKVEDMTPVLLSCSVVVSNYIASDPIWMFLVAAPGEGKSELLGMFRYCKEIYTTSSITPKALISGSNVGGKDSSLLPRLNGKTLCIKDLSTIVTMRDVDRDALLGILRDAYDGSAGKEFGTGSKYYKSRFSMLAGITPSIYELDAQISSLGERFIKVFMGEYIYHRGHFEVVKRAMDNVGKETVMREELAAAAYSFIENIKEHMKSEKYKSPTLRPVTENKIVYLALWCSRLRGVVTRDKFDRDVILNKAYAEVGTRIGKQLKSVMLCLPTVIFRGYDDDNDYNMIKKIALDTVPAKREDLLRVMILECKDENDTLEVRQISKLTKYGYTTVDRIVDDLIALGILEKFGTKRPFRYGVTKSIREYTKHAELYADPLTKNRSSRAEYISGGKVEDTTT